MEAAGGVVRTPRHHERLHLAHQRVLDRVRDLGHGVRLRFGRPALRCWQIKSNLPLAQPLAKRTLVAIPGEPLRDWI